MSRRWLVAVFGLLLPGAMARADWGEVDRVVNAAIAARQMPGAVVLVLHRGEVVYRKAYGHRRVGPRAEAMTLDTVFDLASLTKPIATATSVFLLIDQGKLKLSDPASRYWPEFGKQGKDAITLEHLLTHTSGLLADNALKDYEDGPAEALKRICELKPLAKPGERFIYSDVGFIVLGEIVRRVGGMPLDDFARKHIFEPLGMKETGFNPPEPLRKRAAPADRRAGQIITGVVHDPRAFKLGGVAGHAGLFSTAEDLARYVRGLLAQDRPLLGRSTLAEMTRPRRVPGGLRSCGWDVDTSYSANRGEIFPRGQSFGHTGFTGTSIWIDPREKTAVIFLSNRLHPDGKGNVTRVRGQVATLALKALQPQQRSPRGEFRSGIDVLVAEKFARLRGRKIGLVTNHTGRDSTGRATIDLLHQAPDLKLVALFSPEHGIRGVLDEKVGDSRDAKTGLPIWSLYGERRKPTAETLKGLDTLVYDIQDAGCRFYTYVSTLGLVMEAAAEHKLKVVVLDRPNPINGRDVEGPMLDEGKEAFVAFHRIPVRHGMTVGELARMLNAERKDKSGQPIRCDLEVVAMEGWDRREFFDRTGLTWVNPSPNLRSLTQALLYPGIGLLETTNLSVGRGTDRPFEWVGAPWIDGRKLARALSDLSLPGLRVVPLNLTPSSSVYKDRPCGGVQFIIDDWATFKPLRTGLALMLTLRKLYPNDWKTDRLDVLLRHRQTLEGVQKGTRLELIERSWQADLADFRQRREPYLLYR